MWLITDGRARRLPLHAPGGREITMAAANNKIFAISVRSALRALGSPAKGRFLRRFFKTGPGQYAEGDIFLGITVPAQRQVAAQFKDLPLPEIVRLLRSKIHEERLTALIILGDKFRR